MGKRKKETAEEMLDKYDQEVLRIKDKMDTAFYSVVHLIEPATVCLDDTRCFYRGHFGLRTRPY